MDIRCHCPHCRQRLSIAARKAGQTVRCPACAEPFIVPAEDGGEALAVTATPAPAEPAAVSAPVFAPRPPARPPARRTPPLVAPAAAALDGEEDDDGGFQIRSIATAFEDMDLTPMVDVTFLLLIFFMVTASFSPQKSLKVPPPDPEDKGATQALTIEDLQATSVVVEIDERNNLFVDYEPLNDPTALADTLRGKLLSDHKAEILIEAHEDALHETVVLVIDAAREAGMQKIRISTTRGST